MPAAPTVEVDLPCVGCGYNLRGLPTDGACPECSTRVLLALHPSRLAYAPRGWLKRIIWALTLWAGYGVLRAVAIALSVLVSLLRRTYGFRRDYYFSAPTTLYRWADFLESWPGALTILVALWLLSAREPCRPDRRPLPRYGLRPLTVVFGIAYLAYHVLAFVDRRTPMPTLSWITVPLARFDVVTWYVALTAATVMCAQLAQRLPRHPLAARFMWLTALPLISAATYLARQTTGWTAGRTFGLVGTHINSAMFCVAWVWLVVLLLRLRKEIKAQQGAAVPPCTDLSPPPLAQAGGIPHPDADAPAIIS